MDYELNNLYESFMHKIEKVKSSKEHNPLGKMRQEINDEFSVVKFSCPQLGKYIQDKFNQGRPFSYYEIRDCNLVIDAHFFDNFEKETGFSETYKFNEFRFFNKASYDPGEAYMLNERHLEEITLPNEWTKVPPIFLQNFPNLRKVTLPDSITDIGFMAFMNDEKLEEINVPSQLDIMDGDVFKFCKKLKNFNLPPKYSFWGTNVFEGCISLKKMVIPGDTAYERVSDSCFKDCTGLEEIELLSSVKTVGEHAFGGCSNLRKMTVHSRIKFDNKAFINDSTSENTEVKFDLYVPYKMKSYYMKLYMSKKDVSIHDHIQNLYFF